MKKLLIIAALLLAVAGEVSAQQGNQSVPSGSGSSSASSQGPVINVTNTIYAGGAASSNADNNAQFTAAVAALVASINTGSSGTGVGTPVTVSAQNNTVTNNLSITIPVNSTTLVWVVDGVSPHTFTVSDNGSGGGSSYSQSGITVSNASCCSVRVFATPPGGAKAATQVTVVNNGGASQIVIIVASYPNPISAVLYATNTVSGGAATSFTYSQTTTRFGSSIATGCGFFNTNISSFTATTGTLRLNVASSATQGGLFVADNSSTPLASVTNAGNFSASTNTACASVELQTFGSSTQQPTLYIPAGYYSYSGGLAPTIPSTIKCETGAVLYYTGSAHAIDLGANGLSQSTANWPYFVDGCTFSGGSNMTEGINFNQWIIVGGVRNSTFTNFGAQSSGTSSSHMIASQGHNWDLEVGPFDRFITTDYIPRNILRMNIAGVDAFSFLRFHDNMAACWDGPNANGNNGSGGGCGPASAGIGVHVDGDQNLIFGNSMAFFNPDILLACTNGPCYGNRLEHNLLNTPTAVGTGNGGTFFPPIQFSGAQQAMDIHDNNFDMNGGTAISPIGPRGGADTMQSSRINFNQANLIATSTPFVVLNNLVGQTNNQSSNNMCNTVQTGGTYSPCTTPHTKGANINAFTFNNDDGHQASGYFVVGTKFTTNNGCTDSATAGGATGGTFTVTSTSCTEVITMGDALTAPNGWSCSVIDITTLADVTNPHQTTSTTTTATIVTGTVVSGDKIQFSCIGY